MLPLVRELGILLANYFCSVEPWLSEALLSWRWVLYSSIIFCFKVVVSLDPCPFKVLAIPFLRRFSSTSDYLGDTFLVTVFLKHGKKLFKSLDCCLQEGGGWDFLSISILWLEEASTLLGSSNLISLFLPIYPRVLSN